jgi:hypothetical protein
MCITLNLNGSDGWHCKQFKDRYIKLREIELYEDNAKMVTIKKLSKVNPQKKLLITTEWKKNNKIELPQFKEKEIFNNFATHVKWSL